MTGKTFQGEQSSEPAGSVAREDGLISLTAFAADWYWEQDAALRFVRVESGPRTQWITRHLPLGYTRWEIPGFRPAQGSWETHREMLQRHSSFRDFEARLTLDDGRERILLVSGEPLFSADGAFRGYRGVGRDETETRRAQDLLAASSRVLEMVALGKPLGDVLDTLAREVEAIAPALVCSILMVDEAGRLHHAVAPSLPEDFTALFEGVLIGPECCSCGTAAHRRELVAVEDIATDPLWSGYRDQALALGLRACWSSPVFDSHGAVVGTFALYYRQARLPAEDELQLIRYATRLVAVAVERLQIETALRHGEERLRRLLDMASTLAIQGYDRNGILRYWNRASETIFGFSADQALGRNITDLVIPAEMRDEFAQAVADSAASCEAIPATEEWLLRRDGSRVPVFVSHVVVCLKDRDPELFCLAVDLTRLKAAERAVRDLNETLERRVEARTAELQAANRELESFSYTVSHDLRAPLRAINGFAHILQEADGERLSEEGHKALDRVVQGATRMGQLIDDILRLSRISRQDLRFAELDLDGMLRTLADDLRATYPATRVTLGRLPWVIGDEALLRIAFTNLIDNALKFSSRQPQPVVEIGAENTADRVVIYVRDNGVGFDLQYAGKLFGVFQRMNPEAGFPGTGVGLAIVKRIVDRHGGSVRAETSPGQGATFFVSVPAPGLPAQGITH